MKRFDTNTRLMLMVMALASTGGAITALIFNLYIHALGYRQDFIGLLNGLPAVVVLVVGLPLGIAADRRGYLGFMRVGAVLSVASGLGLALARPPALLVGFSLLGGLGGALTWVIAAPLMMVISRPEDRLHLFAISSAIGLSVGFLGSLLGGALPRLYGGWWGLAAGDVEPLRASLLTAVALSALAIGPLLGMREPRSRPPGAARPLPRNWGEAKLFLKLLGPSALVATGAGAMVVFFQLFFRLRFGLEPGTIGVLFAFASVTTAVATLVSPGLARRFGRVRAVVCTELASIPFLLVLAYSYDLRWVVLAYYFRQALMNMSGPVRHVFLLEQVREDQRATFSSLAEILGGLGRGGLGPIISGFLQVRGGFSAAFTLTSACYVVGAALFYAFFRGAERPPVAGDSVPGIEAAT
ncbi:MAG: MFS transporter [bacterium]|nr:MFS transporter [bacterium]